MPTLTIFANFRINDEERFLRMQDSLRSFKDIDAEKWVVNVRGKFKFETLFFLHEELGDKLLPYMLESKQGWFKDSQAMLKDMDTDFVLYWIEDHKNMVPLEKYKEILGEMKESGAEHLIYSWWHFGNVIKPYASIPKIEYKNISAFVLDAPTMQKIRGEVRYIISAVSILSTPLFKKIITKGLYPFRKSPKLSPGDFEKGAYEANRWLPMKYALPKYELFACIDDDQWEEGYSLRSRGLYTAGTKREWPTPKPQNKWRSLLSDNTKPYFPSLYKKMIRVWESLSRVKKYFYLVITGQ